jgi:hypothetical protein
MAKHSSNARALPELAKSLHRTSERLWPRALNAGKYDWDSRTLERLREITAELSRMVGKLKPRKKIKF